MKCILRYFKNDYIPVFSWIMLFIAIAIGVWIYQIEYNLDVAVLASTAILIFWYSNETYKLVNEQKMDNALQVQPVLVLDYNFNQSYWQILIRNIGKGVAMNVVIKPGNDKFQLILNKPIIPAGECSEIRILKMDEINEYREIRYDREFNSDNHLKINLTFRNTLNSNNLESNAIIYNPPQIDNII